MGYKWQPNDAPTIRQPHAPSLGEDDVLLFDEPGRCGGLDGHSHHFRIVKRNRIMPFLLVAHGGGEERIELFSLAPAVLADLDSNQRYWMMYALFRAYRDGTQKATDTERIKWMKAAAEKRIKTRKQPARGNVKVWIEPQAEMHA